MNTVYSCYLQYFVIMFVLLYLPNKLLLKTHGLTIYAYGPTMVTFISHLAFIN